MTLAVAHFIDGKLAVGTDGAGAPEAKCGFFPNLGGTKPYCCGWLPVGSWWREVEGGRTERNQWSWPTRSHALLQTEAGANALTPPHATNADFAWRNGRGREGDRVGRRPVERSKSARGSRRNHSRKLRSPHQSSGNKLGVAELNVIG